MKKHLLISFGISVLMYLIVAFVTWDILIVTNIPNTDNMSRTIIVFACIAKEAFVWLAYTPRKNNN